MHGNTIIHTLGIDKVESAWLSQLLASDAPKKKDQSQILGALRFCWMDFRCQGNKSPIINHSS
jgi:hypothetical protein